MNNVCYLHHKGFLIFQQRLIKNRQKVLSMFGLLGQVNVNLVLDE
jgi:hypothetical protein